MRHNACCSGGSMRRLAWPMLVLAACDGGMIVDEDSGTPMRDSGPPQFEVRLETAPGDAIENGDMLPVHYGCQGGAHTYFSVIAIGEGLEGAELASDLLGMRATLDMMPTATGAEYLSVLHI